MSCLAERKKPCSPHWLSTTITTLTHTTSERGRRNWPTSPEVNLKARTVLKRKSRNRNRRTKAKLPRPSKNLTPSALMLHFDLSRPQNVHLFPSSKLPGNLNRV